MRDVERDLAPNKRQGPEINAGTAIILEVRGLKKSFGAVAASDGLDLTVSEGGIHALIGPNGAGKTTALAQIAGEVRSDDGTVHFLGEDITPLSAPQRARRKLQRTYQITSLFTDMTVLENALVAVQAWRRKDYRFWRDARSDPALRDPALAALERAGMADLADRPVSGLSHGQRRQLELAVVLAADPTMVLMDEPMAGLGPTETTAMAQLIEGLKGEISVLLVEHDMDVVFEIADTITVLVKGQALMTGTAEQVRNDAQVRDAYLGDAA